MSVLMELARIIISETQDQQVIVLKEAAGERQFPIIIGSTEAYAINRRLMNNPAQRPLTHDLLANVIQAMGGEIEKIEITDLHGSTYFAKIHIHTGNNKCVIDSRPSDAIALGIATQVPIYVADHVIAKACE